MQELRDQAVNPNMPYGRGAESVAATAEIANIENINVWFHSCGVVAERHAAALRVFFSPAHQGAICVADARPPQRKVGVVYIPANFSF